MVGWETVEQQLTDVKKHSWASVLQTYGVLRSLRYLTESVPLFLLEQIGQRKWRKIENEDLKRLQQILNEVWLLIQQDSERIAAEIYPATVLRPDLGPTYWSQLLHIWLKGYRLSREGGFDGAAHDLAEEDLEALRDVPGYYRHHFKYAGNVFLNPSSVSLYEHQMELFYLGAIDAMRRLLLAPMKKAFRFSEGEGLRFLEIGCGEGRMTKFVKMAFPKAKVVVLDASPVYLKRAQQNLEDFSRIDFIQGDALDLPFKEGRFDAVYMSFVLHEVPLEVRRQILAEARRVLTAKGCLGLVDLIQNDDCRELNWTLDQEWFAPHQPYLKDYVQNSLSGLLQRQGFKDVSQERGFLAKAVFATKE